MLQAEEKPVNKLKEWFIGHDRSQQQIIGDESESRFETMTRLLIDMNKLPWAQGLARASTSEDILSGIDFRIRAVTTNKDRTKTEFSIAINVKSSTKANVMPIKINRKGERVHNIIMYRTISCGLLRKILYSFYLREVRVRST